MVKDGIYYIDRPAGAVSASLSDRAAGNTRLRYFDFATRTSKTVTSNLGIVGLGLTASPDGRTILYGRVDSAVDDLMLVGNFH